VLRLLLRLLRQGGATAAAASYHRAPQVEGDEGSVNTPLSAPPVLASAVFPKSAAVFLQGCQLATLPACLPACLCCLPPCSLPVGVDALVRCAGRRRTYTHCVGATVMRTPIALEG